MKWLCLYELVSQPCELVSSCYSDTQTEDQFVHEFGFYLTGFLSLEMMGDKTDNHLHLQGED
jgi:hypothetical protein